MTAGNTRANVLSELVRSGESMRAAHVLVDAGLLHDAESRLYCAIYHAAVAPLLTVRIPAGVRTGRRQTFERRRSQDESRRARCAVESG